LCLHTWTHSMPQYSQVSVTVKATKNTHTHTGVWTSFSRHMPNWRVVQYFHSSSQKTTGQKYRKGQWEGEKRLPDWQMGLYFHLPILNCTSIWRVVIRTPAHISDECVTCD
jgi:hypothetical protein